MKLFNALILIYLLFSLPVGLYAEDILVLTETKSVSGETVRLCKEVYRSGNGQLLYPQFFMTVPGKSVLDMFPLSNESQNQYVLFTLSMSGLLQNKYNDGFYYIHLENGITRDIKYFLTHPDWQIIKVYPYKKGEQLHFIVFEGKESEHISLGRALLFDLEDDKFIQTYDSEIPLPFDPDKICPLGDSGMYIVGKSGYLGIPQFCIVDTFLKMSRPLVLDELQKEYSIYDIAFFENQFLVMLLSFWDDSEQSGKKSEVYVIDTKSWSCITEPMSLLGAGTTNKSNIFVSNGGFWISTESPEDGFGYLTFARWNPVDGWNKELEYSFSGVEYGWIVSIQPQKEMAGVAFGNRIELMGKPFQKSWVGKLDKQVTYLGWLSDNRLIIGSGGKLYYLDITDLSIKEWLTINSGWVSNILPLPSNIELPTPIDENKISIEKIQFQESLAGKETRAVLLNENSPNPISWSVSFLSNPVKWLSWYQEHGLNNDILYLTVIPYHQDWKDLSAWLRIEPILSETANNDVLQPTTKYLHVVLNKKIANPRKVLWIWGQNISDSFRDSKDPRGLKALGDLLAGLPFQFEHEEMSEPSIQNLLPYFQIAVIEAIAIANGVITIKDMLNYVSDGGNVLLLGDYWPQGDPHFFNYWLSSINAYYNPKQRVDGVFPVETNDILTSCWKDFSITGGGTLKCIPITKTIFPSTNHDIKNMKQVAFLTRSYGYGKIAILAGRTPINTQNLVNPLNRVFALQLFQWLSQADTNYADVDGDGLEDLLEDRNQNGVYDIGETHPLKCDTDRDGIPDGLEDLNHNGIWDTDETDPTCEDSDGDNIWDGADVQVILAPNKVIISRLDPANAPAEGGNLIFIQGRNFSTDTQFCFGTRPSPLVRILSPEFAMAVAPEYPINRGGKTFVYAIRGSDQTTMSPKKPFIYEPKNEVIVSMSSITDEKTNNVIYGGVRFEIIPPSKKYLQRVNILLRISKTSSPQIKPITKDKNCNITLNRIKDDWCLLKVEIKKERLMRNPIIFDIYTSEQIESEEPVKQFKPEIIKIWAETLFNGKFIVKFEDKTLVPQE